MSAVMLAAASLGAVALVIALAYRPLGDYMAGVFTTTHHLKIERVLYRTVGVNPDGGQSWQAYLRAVLLFSAAGVALLYALMRLQSLLPYSLGLPGMSPGLAFNTAISFVGNTNWQS
jgi:K+-transporting ATPase ATPase A chain